MLQCALSCRVVCVPGKRSIGNIPVQARLSPKSHGRPRPSNANFMYSLDADRTQRAPLLAVHKERRWDGGGGAKASETLDLPHTSERSYIGIIPHPPSIATSHRGACPERPLEPRWPVLSFI